MVVLVVLVIVLAIVAGGAIVIAAVRSSRLRAQRQATTAAESAAEQRSTELATATASLETERTQRTEAEARASAAEEAASRTDEARSQAERRADEAQAAAEQARLDATAAAERADAADRRVSAAERPPASGVDAEVLWALERLRSERTWRLSVATGPDTASSLVAATDPLVEALRIELEAAREEIGAIVELDVELAGPLTSAGTLLTLRAAQELLAAVVRASEDTVLSLRTDGRDVVVSVRGLDEHGEPVLPSPLPLPPSLDVDVIDAGSLRVRDALEPAET